MPEFTKAFRSRLKNRANFLDPSLVLSHANSFRKNTSRPGVRQLESGGRTEFSTWKRTAGGQGWGLLTEIGLQAVQRATFHQAQDESTSVGKAGSQWPCSTCQRHKRQYASVESFL